MITKIFSKLLTNSTRVGLLIMGAQKAGTHALFNILNSSKYFSGSTTKETDFFNSNLKYNRGISYYHSFYSKRDLLSDRINFEASVNYMYYPDAIKRIHAYNDNIKLIFLLRNPITRSFSEYNMLKNDYSNNRKLIKNYYAKLDQPFSKQGIDFLSVSDFPSFEKVVLDEINSIENNGIKMNEPGIITRSLYANQINNCLKYFTMDDMMFIDSNDLYFSPSDVLENIGEFLGLKEIIVDEKQLVNSHFKGNYSKKIALETHLLLQDFFEPYNKELFTLLGKNFNWN